ncbi:MAG TPA: sensor histidine kinase [Nocardioides sp.]|nr:sensor histidine kinase [Nocardioides sp.]
MSTASSDAATRGRTVVLPAVLVGFVAVVTVLAAYVDLLTSPAERDVAQTSYGVSAALIGAVLVVAAAAILQARPGHRVGLVLAALGLVWNVDGLAESWSAYSLGSGAAGTDFAFWFVARFGAVLLPGFILLLLLYPTGRLMSGRWRRIGQAVVAASCGLPLALLIAPDDVVYRGEVAVPGVNTDLLAVPLPDDVWIPLLTLTRILTLLSLLGALALLYLRHRAADGLERRQLRWLLWAGIVCAVMVPVLILAPSGTLTTVVLGVAVTLTAVSVAVGVVRPDLADVDALVAGTLTYAGVAGVLIGLDFLLLGLAGTFLGDRLDERGVTVLVLVLAVAAYGPLRGWLGAGVHRLLFGRRGDRYGVVSTFAATLEETRTVDEQLPALASAVASTFKVPYVRVEVLAPDGGVLAADHGDRTPDTYDLDIAYHGQRVGRLVLPRQGLRAMLSRRDQTLLVDLVRQGAVAIRTSNLARELQQSRERLVIAREEDRRRIRRDLHDGLGPVLGGVGMRLEAAGNAMEDDPETARRLLRQSRTEIGDALADVRRLVHDLRPPALDDLGLLAAIEQQADRARSVLEVDVRVDDLGSLSAAAEVAAYRIASEALNNVVRHAGATRCEIRLSTVDSALEVSVVDDGRGIAEDVVAGVGLLSLRERAEELGGRCEITCPESGGTRVWAWLPFGEGGHD